MGWFGKLAKIGSGWAANPILGSAMGAKEILGQANKIPSRGFNTNEDKLNQAYDLYAQNEKKNPYDKYYDPRLRTYQKKALDRLYKISSSKELDAQAKAQLNKIRQQEAQLERGSREAIMQNAAERGASSSTGNLMAQLMNQQMGADRRTNQDTDVAADLQKRALDALYGSINTAQGINQQDMGRAQAQDMFNRYNIGGKSGVLGQQGQNAIDKAQAQNSFWGGLIGTAAGAIAGGPAGTSMGQNIVGQMAASPTGLQANNTPNPFSTKPRLTGYDWKNVMQYQPGYNPIL